MASPSPSTILFSPGPHGTFILLCGCGYNEVSRDRSSWRRLQPDFDRDLCRCLACGIEAPLSHHDDPRRHFRRP